MIFIYVNKGQDTLTKSNYIRTNEILRKSNLFSK